MNKYDQFILNIIINRGRFAIPDGEYKEEHHIVPKCMGGTDDEQNLVHLYAREHIVAHKLLTEIYPGHSGIWDAFWQMCNCNKYDDFFTPKEYELARIKHSENMRENNPMKRPEMREAMSERMRGENNPMKRPEVRAKIMGENHPMKRPEVRRKMIDSMPKKPVEAIDPETGKRALYFNSTHDAGRAGFDPSNVVKCCRGKYKTHAGLIWRYVEEVNNDDSDN